MAYYSDDDGHDDDLTRQRMRAYDRRPKRSLNTIQGLLLGAVLGALLFVAIVWVGANVSLSGIWHPFG
jgi:hypothetical protein